MTPVEFVRLTSRETGGELFLRRDMIAAVCSGYKGVTHITLVNEDVDFEVKESVRDVLRLVTGEDYETKPTNTRRPFRTSHLSPGGRAQVRPSDDSVPV